jgi:Ser/Thr protein kinase RdoA (MazF antagonist)
MSFANLLPDTIFDAVGEQGLVPTGTLFALNSYENRVYEIHLEDRDPIVAKFYRPGRWSEEALGDEHRFLKALGEVKIPVVQPLLLKKHLPSLPTLGIFEGYYFAFFPKFRGREHPDITNDDRQLLGRSLARLHNFGEVFKADHRFP